MRTYRNFLLETLKSYEIPVVRKKLINLFNGYGFNGYSLSDFNKKPPYYIIYSDRDTMLSTLSGLKDKNSESYKWMIDNNQDINKRIKYYESMLNDFKYGDIYVFVVHKNKNIELNNKLLQLIESVGYFVSKIGNYDVDLDDKSKIKDFLQKSDKITMIIEPLYDTKIDFSGEFLYHTTNKRVIDKIMKFGLIPKSKNTRSFYPNRIYLSPNIKYMNSIKSQLKMDKKDNEFVDLKIKNFDGLTLYKDVRFKGGFFTYDNISPKYITIIN